MLTLEEPCIILLATTSRGMYLVVSVCLFLRKQNYLKTNERIYMKLLPAASRPTNPLFLGDDPDHDLHRTDLHETFTHISVV